MPVELQWASWSASSQSTRVLPLVDRFAHAALGSEMRAERQRWLVRSPQYLGFGVRNRAPFAGHRPAMIHIIPMRRMEAECFRQSVLVAITNGNLPASLFLWYGTELLVPPSTAAT